MARALHVPVKVKKKKKTYHTGSILCKDCRNQCIEILVLTRGRVYCNKQLIYILIEPVVTCEHLVYEGPVECVIDEWRIDLIPGQGELRKEKEERGTYMTSRR